MAKRVRTLTALRRQGKTVVGTVSHFGSGDLTLAVVAASCGGYELYPLPTVRVDRDGYIRDEDRWFKWTLSEVAAVAELKLRKGFKHLLEEEKR